MEYYYYYRAGKFTIRKEPQKRNMRVERAFGEEYSEENIIQRILIECGIEKYYNNISELIERIKKVKNEIISTPNWKYVNIIDKICYIFIDSVININDFEIKRLKNIEAKDFYKNFIKKQKFQLKDRIKDQYEYFKSIQHNSEKNEF